MPRRGGRYEQIAGDAVKRRILYIEPVPWFYGRGVTEKFLRKLDGWGIQPNCVIFDLWTTFPKVVRKVWPEVPLQYDYFHVMQRLWYYLKNSLIQFRKSLDPHNLKPSSMSGDKWKLSEEDLKPPKDVSIISNSSRSLTTSNYLFKNHNWQVI